ncbi:DNA sulfur modification protein DndD [Amycolatopsis arida]|uniref:Nuclease SbcCD subunit C n=1 Tax=Amycolatopsis arida TaxID=587909 RepID=A0A1I5YFW4_9PSEU|nr:AAA family ATPase [Amycolatopsis arida]TDX90485.1 DNA sulfur modification protein DndD [Amycolatopsis arida]SFQ43084.1 DNA sulfur modification protein DndD [Amycolatopsis arida]
MRLVSMELTDVGLYRGVQRFDFANKHGIELIWGENGRGKTTFLNAIRWALFGIMLGRGSTRIDPATVGNRDDADASVLQPFKVTLVFEHHGHIYKLTRAYRKDAGQHLFDRGSFSVVVSLVKDGDVLGPEERDRELATLLPEQTARFFLFDAELLQEYEELLIEGSEAGDKLKAAIERILGLPVLTHARDDIGALLAKARTAQAKAAQKDKSTRAIGNELQLAQQEAENERKNVDELVGLVEELQNDLNEVEKRLAANTRFRGLMASRDTKKNEVERLRERVSDREEELAEEANSTWRAILMPVVGAELAKVEELIDSASNRLTRAITAQQMATAATTGYCPTCRQAVQADVIQGLHDGAEAGDVTDVQRELVSLRARRDVLRKLRADGEHIARLEDELSQARVDLTDAESELGELNAQMDEAPEGTEESIVSLTDQYGNIRVSLNNTRTRLKASRQELERANRAVAALSQKLQQVRGAGTGQEDRKVNLLSNLHQLLVAAVDDFRDRLRDRVEEQASEVFRVLSAEQDYDRLQINANYGLKILHKDGSEVLNRSSGYEHIVAISLIAALQRCSQTSGPIITDSPFGRLDKTHRAHVLRTFPQITDQVVLLAHEEELNRQVALAEIGTYLVGEHHLRRVSARHTEIEAGAPA